MLNGTNRHCIRTDDRKSCSVTDFRNGFAFIVSHCFVLTDIFALVLFFRVDRVDHMVPAGVTGLTYDSAV